MNYSYLEDSLLIQISSVYWHLRTCKKSTAAPYEGQGGIFLFFSTKIDYFSQQKMQRWWQTLLVTGNPTEAFPRLKLVLTFYYDLSRISAIVETKYIVFLVI